MRLRNKLLLVLELSFSFTPIVLMWLWGLTMVVPGVMHGKEFPHKVLWAVFLGGLGILGIILGTKNVFQVTEKRRECLLSIVLILSGLAALLVGTEIKFKFSVETFLFFWLPIVVAMHLIGLLIQQLTRRSTRTRATTARAG